MNLERAMRIVSTVMVMSILWVTPVTKAQEDVDALLDLWDYGDPGATELLFLSMVDEATRSQDPDDLPVLLTQIARTHSLRNQFDLAHDYLDRAEALVTDRKSRARIYLLLERGRTWNSSGKKTRARNYFKDAFVLAEQRGNDYLAIDAAHMVAITEPVDRQMKWNIIALGIAENSPSTRARKWLGSLYNNTGWTLFDQGRYEQALAFFEKGVVFRREQGQARRLQIARWAVGRTLRALKKYDEALAIQRELEEERKRAGLAEDGFVMEELAELYLVRESPLASEYFGKAYRLLSADEWLVENEPERLERLKRLVRR